MAERKLTPKQEAFCQEYLIDLNATQAAIRAGYSERTADRIGPKLVAKSCVATRIAELQAERAKRTAITADRVLEEFAIMGFSDMADFAEWDTSSVRLKDSKTLDVAKRRAVIEVSETQHGVKIKLADKKGPLDSIARHLGMFLDKDHSPTNNAPVVVVYMPNNDRDKRKTDGYSRDD